MKGYYYKFISLSFPFLLLSNIGMETNNHSNLIFLSSSKCYKWNHQIHFYSLRNRNGNKIFIFILYSDIPNIPLVFYKNNGVLLIAFKSKK